MAEDVVSLGAGKLPDPGESYLTPDRLELAAWMRRYAPSLADLYLGALRLLYGPAIPGRVVLIAHAVREICNRLPERVSGVEGDGRLDYTARVDMLAAAWERAGLTGEGEYPAGSYLDNVTFRARGRKLLAGHAGGLLGPRLVGQSAKGGRRRPRSPEGRIRNVTLSSYSRTRS